jgi:hypothetical protein
VNERVDNLAKTVVIRGLNSIDYNFPFEKVFTLRDHISLQSTNHTPHAAIEARRVSFFLQKCGVDILDPQSFLGLPAETQAQIKKGISRILKRNGR